MTDAAPPLGPVKAPEDVTSRNDRFHCVPYNTTQMALGCVQRQAIVRAGKKRIDWEKCLNCELGRTIEMNSGGAMVVKHDKKHGGWGRMVLPEKHTPKRRSLPIIAANDDAVDDPDEPTIPTLGGSLRADPADVEADEDERDLELDEAHDTDPAPPPTPRPSKPKPKEKPMTVATDEERTKKKEWNRIYFLRTKLKAAGVDVPPKGTPIAKLEAMLRGIDKTNGVSHSSNGVTITKPRRKKGEERAVRMARKVHSAPPASSASLTDQLSRALEAVELLDRIGWNFARTLAAALEERAAS